VLVLELVLELEPVPEPAPAPQLDESSEELFESEELELVEVAVAI
jgi:hypothetical protein